MCTLISVEYLRQKKRNYTWKGNNTVPTSLFEKTKQKNTCIFKGNNCPHLNNCIKKRHNSVHTSLKSETLLVALLSPMESGLSGSTGALPLTVVGTILAPGICVVRAGIDWAVVTLPELCRNRWICRFWFSVTWNCVGFSSWVFTYRQTESSSSQSHRKTSLFFFKNLAEILCFLMAIQHLGEWY